MLTVNKSKRHEDMIDNLAHLKYIFNSTKTRKLHSNYAR